MKKIFKKSLSLVAVFAMVMTLVIPNSSYALETGKPELKVTVDKEKISKGEEVTAVVSMDSNSVSDLINLGIHLQYDTNVLEPESEPTILAPSSSLGGNWDAAIDVKNPQLVNLAAISTNVSSYKGQLYSVTFKAKSDATLGKTTLEILPTADGTGPITNSIPVDVPTTIVNSEVEIIQPAESISLDKTESKLNVGENEQLIPTILPADTTDTTVTWTSSNSAIATVNKEGLVDAVAPGNVTITATINGKSATCTYTVSAPLQSISIGDDFEIAKNQTKDLTVTYNPANTTDLKDVTWESSDESIAKVENGELKALKEGTAVITATVGTFQSSITVTVKEIPLNSISIDQTENTLNRGDKTQYTVSFNPNDTTDDKTLTWESSDPTIATVDKDGNVEALKEGTTTITVKCGAIETTKELTVKENHIESVSLVKSEEDKLAKGNTIPLWLAINPENYTDQFECSFTSSDENVVKVDNFGNVTGVNEGKATVSVKLTTEYGKELTGSIDLEIAAEGTGVVTNPLNQSTNGTTNTTSSPKTGDMPIALITVLAALTLGTTVFIARKKLIKQK